MNESLENMTSLQYKVYNGDRDVELLKNGNPETGHDMNHWQKPNQ